MISPAKVLRKDNMWGGHYVIFNFKDIAWQSPKSLLIPAKLGNSVLSAHVATRLVKIFLYAMKLLTGHYHFINKNLNKFSEILIWQQMNWQLVAKE